MKRFIKSRTILQVTIATLITTLTTAGIVLATTTINNNVSTANLTASGTLAVTGAATLSSTLAVTGAATLSSTAAISDDLSVNTNDLYVDISANRTGIGTSTPWATLSIDTNAGDNAFVIGSSTATYLRVDTNGVLRGNESLGDSADLRWDGTTNTHLLFADVSAERVGIASSSPTAQLSVGAGGTASSTMAVGRFCIRAQQENGTTVYLYLGANQAANQPFATSSTSCF